METFINAFKKECLKYASELEISRNEYLIKEGQIEHYIYWIKSGAVRIIYLTELEEHTIRLGYKDSLINSLASFLNNTPSDYYIQAIRKTILYKIAKPEFEAFLERDPNRLKQYNTLLQNVIIEQLEREKDLLTHSPIERLKRVLQRSPQLFQEIPARYIASYLRMTPETFSRVKNLI